MSNLQHSLQARAGGLFVLVEGVGIDISVVEGWLWPRMPATVATSVPPAIIRLAAVWRREWTFSSYGRPFFLRISLKR